MKSRTLTCITTITLFAALAVPVQLTAQKQIHYTVTDLGTLGGTFSQAFGVNNKGSVVGFATLPGDTALHAFLWREGLMIDLGTLRGAAPPAYSQPFSVNESDEVVGFSETSDPDPLGENFCGDSLVCLPFLWQGGVMTPLPTLGGNNGQAGTINNRGQVVGTAENSIPDPTCAVPQVLQFKPVIWEKSQARELPTVGGDPEGLGGPINDNGRAVGVTFNCSGSSGHAVLWHNGAATDMGTLGDLGLAPSDINNKGQVVGTAGDPSGAIQLAFLWQNGVASSLGTLPGDVQSHSNSINDKGQVEGQSCAPSGFPDCSVFLWQNGLMTDLNTVSPAGSPHMVDSGKINARGQIVGLAITSTGEFHAFLASPTDESQGGPTSSAAQSTTHSRPRVVIPENLKLLRQRLGHWYHTPGIGASERD
jgi:probable HAF family extracellular repeat protein